MEDTNKAAVTKRVRASKPKVKTGCKTCRTRRVKCDEKKPACYRCLRFGVTCDGYERPLLKARPLKIKPLAPAAHIAKTPLLPSLAKKLFENGEEYRFFQQFCSETALQFTGPVDSDLWNRIILQTSQVEPSIRHAIMAIGALDFKTQIPGLHACNKSRQEFAYHQYGLAIAKLSKANGEGLVDVRTKLLSCLLFACFESYCGNNELASAQVFAGVSMLREYQKPRSQNPAHRADFTLPKRMRQPIEEDIVEALNVLEISSVSYHDPRSYEVHIDRMKADQEQIDNIPKAFENLKESRRVLGPVMLRAIHFVLSRRTSKVPMAFQSLGWVDVDPEYSQLCRHFSEFNKWHIAFEPLLRQARTPGGTRLFRNATFQELHYLTCLLWLAAAAPTEMYYTRYTRELVESLRLIKILLEPPSDPIESASYHAAFSIDIRLIMPLQAIAFNYRHRAVRREAVKILKTIPFNRDGIWDGTMTCNVIEWVSSLEEEGLGDEEIYVPSHLAAKIKSLKVVSATRAAEIVIELPDKQEPDKLKMRGTTIYW